MDKVLQGMGIVPFLLFVFKSQVYTIDLISDLKRSC